jgi:TRAP transporter TAXI family solute receptor
MRGPWRALLIAAMAVLATASTAQEARFFRIGTGGTAGTYFPVGSIIANAISNPPGSRPCDKGGSCGVPGLIAIVQSSNGSVENVRQIDSGEFELALTQADIAYWAYHGTGLFREEGAIDRLRVIANLYPESLHIVMRRDSGVRSVADLRGKHVSLGEEGSGTLVVAKVILEAYGLSHKDMNHAHLAVGASSLAMQEGALDGFFFIGGYPVPAVSDLARNVEIELIAVTGVEAENLIAFYPFLTPNTIPAGTYQGTGETVTVGLGAQLVVSADIDEDTVYGITRALWHENTRRLLDDGHAKGREIRLETALEGVAIPIHRGAERYYREVGILE